MILPCCAPMRLLYLDAKLNLKVTNCNPKLDLREMSLNLHNVGNGHWRKSTMVRFPATLLKGTGNC